MKEQRLLFLLLLTTLSLSAQVKGVVLDSISGKPIAYVNIWVENENIGTTSEENGTFSLDIKEEKNIVFSALGYETRILKSTESEKVNLYPKVYEMPEVVLEDRKGTKEIVVSKYKKNSISLYYGAGVQPTIIARKIEAENEIKNHPFLKEIIFLSTSQIENAKIILRFFEVDSEGNPGNDYLENNIVLKIKKGKKNNKVDLSEYKINIPENGLFIAFEWMIIEENKYVYEYTINEENNKVKYKNGVNYQPFIGTVPSNYQTSWTFSNAKWFKREKHEKISKYSSQYESQYGELAIQLTLSN